MMKQRLRIFGARVRASVVVDLIRWQFADQIELEGYYDDRLPAGAEGPGGHPILGTVSEGLDHMPTGDAAAFLALGTRASARGCEIFLALQASRVKMLSLVSPTAHVSPSARIGQSTILLPGVFVGAHARVGHLVCAHGGSIIEHHSQIGHNVLLGPGVAMSGFVRIGGHCFLGTGSRFTPEVSVGNGTLVGAGSLVVRDLPAHVIAFGQPAVPIRQVRAGDEVPVEEDVHRLDALERA